MHVTIMPLDVSHITKQILLTSLYLPFPNGEFNKQNTRYLAHQNQHVIREGKSQEKFGVNVWVSIVGNNITGSTFLPGQLKRG